MSTDTAEISTETPEWVDRWKKHLRRHGPQQRWEIERRLGFVTGAVTPYTVLWSEEMDMLPDETYEPDQLVRMEVCNPKGHGGPVMIYLLWGQRHRAFARYPNRTKRKADRK